MTPERADDPGRTVLDFAAFGGVRLRLRSDQAITFGEDDALVLDAYLSGEDRAKGEGKVDGVIVHLERAAPRVAAEARRVVIEEPWNGRLSPDVPHLLHAMARRAWAERGWHAAHAACVETAPGEGALLVGHSGSGKTTTALEILRRGAGRLVAGNKTVISFDEGMTAIGGRQVVTLPKADLVRHQDLLRNAADYGGRVAARLDPALITKGPVRIRKIVFVRLDGSRTELERLSTLSALHRLQPFLLDVVNADVVLAGGAGVYCGDIPPRARRWLAEDLARTLGAIDIVAATGSPAFVAETLR